MDCTVHENYFEVVRKLFGKCSLVDQLALFEFVDRYVDPNHVIFFLMKEALNSGVRIAEKTGTNGRLVLTVRKNLIVVNDGTLNVDALARISTRPGHEASAYERVSGHRRLHVKSLRNYSDVLSKLNDYDAQVEDVIRPTYVSREDNESSESDDDNDDPSHDIPRAKRRKRTVQCADESERGTRNVLKLFSISGKSIQSHYNEVCALLVNFWAKCESSTYFEKHDERGQFHRGLNVSHVTYDIQSNNILTNVLRSFPLSNDERYLFRETLVDADSSPEFNLPLRSSAWPMNEEWTIHCEPAQDIYNDGLERKKNAQRALNVRLVRLRHNVDQLLAKHQPINAVENRADVTPRGTLDDTESDEQRLFRLGRFTPSTHPITATEFRIQHESEFALLELKRITSIVSRLSDSSCIKLYDFVLTSANDFWTIVNSALDYAISCKEKHGVYPSKHSLWDVGLVAKSRSSGTHNSYALDNYYLVWLHSPTLLSGNLTIFVQSFRRLILAVFNTCACFLLNRAVARNRRKQGGKHECRLSKASQNAYYALFLRMNLGHELLCNMKIETSSDALNWLAKYCELTETLWLKKQIPRPTLLQVHLDNLRSQIHYKMQERQREREHDHELHQARPANTQLIERTTVHNQQQTQTGESIIDDDSVLDYEFDNESNY